MVVIRRRIVVALLVAGALATACGFTLDGYEGGAPSTPEAGASDTSTVSDASAPATDAPTTSDASADAAPIADAASDGMAVGCANGGGPVMVRVGGANATFCVDATEVTNGQYAAFLSTGPSLTMQPAVCAFNTSFQPSSGTTIGDPTQTNYPITNVNWCDAYTFCKWAGKRLCGKVGGGASSSADFAVGTNEFYVACSKDGTQTYPYGNQFAEDDCNAAANGTLEPVAHRALCQGGYPGIYDILGNVGEWQNDCDTQDGGGDTCVDNATSYEYASGDLTIAQRCDHFDQQYRSDSYNDLGFRCCAD